MVAQESEKGEEEDEGEGEGEGEGEEAKAGGFAYCDEDSPAEGPEKPTTGHWERLAAASNFQKKGTHRRRVGFLDDDDLQNAKIGATKTVYHVSDSLFLPNCWR